uniref:Uncharacterized protein n=1 Tax=Lotharella globosa TaxID=91324 RepID=A0A7S3Z8G3_9EUKA|mmetsp:Transcript_4771/g.9282  ORF Transcript_4771/g.9282 Transcript_4771/m.9282 type:complete len:169 (+) Transcript_4771:67-573(+)
MVGRKLFQLLEKLFHRKPRHPVATKKQPHDTTIEVTTNMSEKELEKKIARYQKKGRQHRRRSKRKQLALPQTPHDIRIVLTTPGGTDECLVDTAKLIEEKEHLTIPSIRSSEESSPVCGSKGKDHLSKRCRSPHIRPRRRRTRSCYRHDLSASPRPKFNFSPRSTPTC